MATLQTSIGSIALSSCLYNASGPRTGSTEALALIGKSKSGAILSKSTTLVKQDGNTLPRSVNKIKLGKFCEGSINSEGLPNSGIDYYISSDAISSLTHFSKPYIISLSGLTLEDNLIMIRKVLEVPEIAGIELNLACPNVPGKPIIAYDFEQMDQVLAQVTAVPGIAKKPLGVKLAPYFDLPHFKKAIEVIAKYKAISFVVTINTVGNALFVDAEAECASIAPKGGFGGLGGGFVKPTALANVRLIYQQLQEQGRTDIDVVGAGGVSCGTDAFEMILCGAKAVQIGTCHWTEGAGCFERIALELAEIMSRKGYRCIEDFRGKLKPYVKHTSKLAVAVIETSKGAAPVVASDANAKVYVAVIVALVSVIFYLVAEKLGIKF